MKAEKKILIHVLVWVFLIANIQLAIYSEKDGKEPFITPRTIMYYVGLVSAFYASYSLICPLFLKRGKLVHFVVIFVCSSIVYTAVALLLDSLLSPELPSKRMYAAIPITMLGILIYSIEQSFRKENENISLKQEKAQAEITFLRAQVNPHFLYNTLNYMYYVARPDSPRLADIVLRLSNLMRYTLIETPDGQIALKHEIEHIRNYIQLIEMRFSPHFHVTLNVEGDPGDVHTAALLFIPFVENAIKHGVVTDPANPVSILFRITEKKLSFQICNLVNHDNKPPSSGVGLANVRRRLELLYPGNHLLSIQENETLFKAALEINL